MAKTSGPIARNSILEPLWIYRLMIPSILFQAGRFALRTNRLNDAKQFLDRAILLDPKTKWPNYTRSFLNWTMGKLDEADNDFRKAYSLNLADQIRNYEMALIARDKGKYEEAISWMEREENSFLILLLQCSIYHAMGKTSESREILEQIKKHPHDEDMEFVMDSEAELNYEIACLYAFMEEYDNAFAYLDKSFEHVLIWPERLFTTPEFNKLRGDPRWESFLIRLGVVFNYEFLPFEKG